MSSPAALPTPRHPSPPRPAPPHPGPLSPTPSCRVPSIPDDRESPRIESIVAICGRLLWCAAAGGVAMHALHVVACTSPDSWSLLRDAVGTLELQERAHLLPEQLRHLCAEPPSGQAAFSTFVHATCRWLLADTCHPLPPAAKRRRTCTTTCALPVTSPGAEQPHPHAQTDDAAGQGLSSRRDGTDAFDEHAISPPSTLRRALRANLGTAVANGCLRQVTPPRCTLYGRKQVSLQSSDSPTTPLTTPSHPIPPHTSIHFHPCYPLPLSVTGGALFAELMWQELLYVTPARMADVAYAPHSTKVALLAQVCALPAPPPARLHPTPYTQHHTTLGMFRGSPIPSTSS